MYKFKDMNKMTKDELKKLAQDAGIEKISAMKKLDKINL